MIKMSNPQFHSVTQGSPEWLSLRTGYLTASEAPAMLGVSRFQTRSALLRQKATAGENDIYQPVADKGHASEAAAIDVAAGIIGDDLYPATVTREVEGLRLLASCDGMTMDSTIGWENKLYREEVAPIVDGGTVPDEYRPQLEQQLLVTGAEKILFSMADHINGHFAWCWYFSDPSLRERLISGWRQFSSDLKTYKHVEPQEVVAGAVQESMPLLVIDISGEVLESNLVTYQQAVSKRIQAIKTDLKTDQDFADADQIIKALENGEKEVEAAKGRALAKTKSIDELFRTIDTLKEEMRQKRLVLEKAVKARKTAIRAEIIDAAVQSVASHAQQVRNSVDDRIEAIHPPHDMRDRVAAAIKGKRTITSLQDAADQAVTDAKLEINADAARASANLKAYDAIDTSHAHLFGDLGLLVNKEPDDFLATVKLRIAEEEDRQRKLVEEERERARQDEERRRLAAEQEHARQEEMASVSETQSEVASGRDSKTVGRVAHSSSPSMEFQSSTTQSPSDSTRNQSAKPMSARVVDGGIQIALSQDWIQKTYSIDEATQLRDALSAALREARRGETSAA
ncbi:MAG: YqaJ viral recombinase family protein [Hyphomicrobiaceae bacterium]|nr:YqaJ viral recombinase family protein [Hyphomicrobiaceae bacterium]